MASGRIKGITIEIGGDTTSLTKSLSEVDRAVKDTQANLRDINKALKFDSGNVELLKLKQDNLNDSVDEAKRRLQADTQTRTNGRILKAHTAAGIRKQPFYAQNHDNFYIKVFSMFFINVFLSMIFHQ